MNYAIKEKCFLPIIGPTKQQDKRHFLNVMLCTLVAGNDQGRPQWLADSFFDVKLTTNERPHLDIYVKRCCI